MKSFFSMAVNSTGNPITNYAYEGVLERQQCGGWLQRNYGSDQKRNEIEFYFTLNT